MIRKITVIIITAILTLALASCAGKVASDGSETSVKNTTEVEVVTEAETEKSAQTSESETAKSDDTDNTGTVTSVADVTSDGAIDATDLFSNRDLTQTPDLSEASYFTLADGEDINITSAGVYVISGSASDVTVSVDAGDEDKVQIVLDGASITNSDFPAIYVKNADKVFVTTTDSENSLSVTGAFSADGETNTDAVIFSRDDLVLNGLGTLNISSTDNGVTSKDDLKITGGTINISCTSDALEANDSIRIADGDITISTEKDGLHAENDEDNTLGYVYICGGNLSITAGDDGIHGTTIVQIDGGDITINAAEGIEGTWVQINGGTINITASDDGINGARKSTAYTAAVEINGGYTTISMGQGDTDGIDSNGNLYINGGTVDITGQSAFDYDGVAEYNGGTMIVNGQKTTTITNQMMGGMGGMDGGFGGNMPSGAPGGNMPGGPGGFGRR